MTNLSQLQLLPAYHKGLQDIARDFYLPCMAESIRYDRAVAFFRSSIFIIAWPSLKVFIQNGGNIRLICSPFLTSEDLDAIDEGYRERIFETYEEAFKNQIIYMLDDPVLSKPTKVLGGLISNGILNIKVALLEKQIPHRCSRIFHDKVGIFTDDLNHRVVFKGSMNETWSGLALDGNLESIDVFVSWEDSREANRTLEELQYFDSLWENKYPEVEIRDFPDAAKEILTQAADVENWSKLVEEITQEVEANQIFMTGDWSKGRTPMPHQQNAIRSWRVNHRRGILEHATGSGKTFTALCIIRDALSRGETPIILVPTQELHKQWEQELSHLAAACDAHLLLCGGGHTKWRQKGLLNRFTKAGRLRRMVLSTMRTASLEDFRALVDQGEHLLLVGDEVHRLGSLQNQKIFELNTGPRLGLSATPRRAGDPEGTAKILEYFQGVIQPPFTLMDAIKSGFLTPYMYYIHPLKLSAFEQGEWDQFTKKIKRLYARYESEGLSKREIRERLQNLFINRARIIKGAEAKVDIALEVVKEYYTEGDRWIVYCDDQEQLFAVLGVIQDHGYDAGQYHSAMPGDRVETLKRFEINGGILVSIRCLDEGVDIPSVSHALILASSKNPREFIQRRGRVLRRFPGKSMSFVHDAIVMPNSSAGDADGSIPGLSIIEGELARAAEFGQSADNPAVVRQIQKIALAFGLDPDRLIELVEEGFEDDD